ncbi:MAG TPA: HisA/HisF-related TIM barrel protein [Abditibacterium sp.]|jgi:cyclase
MLKIRVMPTLLWRENALVKGVGFDSWRIVGSAMQAVKLFNMREVDELIFLDIGATRDASGPDFDLIDNLADECFMPLTVGGGVRDVDDVRRLLQVGADKVALNTMAVDSPLLIEKISRRFGVQCVVVSIDFRRDETGAATVWTRSATYDTGLDVVKWAQEAERRGAGEILLASIERDGTLEGYDLETTRRVCEAVSIPVIASGGAGKYEDMAGALRAGASALAAGALWQFTQATPLGAKNFLATQGFAVRN